MNDIKNKVKQDLERYINECSVGSIVIWTVSFDGGLTFGWFVADIVYGIKKCGCEFELGRGWIWNGVVKVVEVERMFKMVVVGDEEATLFSGVTAGTTSTTHSHLWLASFEKFF